MKRIFYFALIWTLPWALAACFDVDDENFRELASVTFNDVSETIDVALGEELVYDKLEVKSDRPVTYEWGYGIAEGSEGNKVKTLTVISDRPDIRYTFNRVGSYVLRLKVDNGESIVFKYFRLNVNSGLDEGILLLNNDPEGKASLTFIKKRTEDEIAADAQEVYPDIFSTINPDATLRNGTDLFLSYHTTGGVQYRSLLVTTDDGQGNIYKLEPKTFELYATVAMRTVTEASCAGIVGDAASAALANYALIRGSNGHTYRYDLFGDFVGERADATAAGLVTRTHMATYYTSATATKPNRKPILYNGTTLFQPVNSKVTSRTLPGYRIVNLCSKATKNLLYILFESVEHPGTYCIQSSTSTLGALKSVATDFTPAGNLCMDENSIMVNTRNSSDVYYSYDNKVYRWSLTSAPPTAAKISLPAGEIIRSMATNYMGAFNDGTEETLLYIATYNPDRPGDKKGSLYIYKFEDDSLLKAYEGICDDPVKVLYKYRMS